MLAELTDEGRCHDGNDLIALENGRKELTQKEVAQKMGISQSYISRLEKKIMLRLRKEFLRQTSCA